MPFYGHRFDDKDTYRGTAQMSMIEGIPRITGSIGFLLGVRSLYRPSR
jgi:hypothetical protein